MLAQDDAPAAAKDMQRRAAIKRELTAFMPLTAAASTSALPAPTVILPASTAFCLSSTDAAWVKGVQPVSALLAPGRHPPLGKPVLGSMEAALARAGAASTPAPAILRMSFRLICALPVCMRRPDRAGVEKASAEAASTAATAAVLSIL